MKKSRLVWFGIAFVFSLFIFAPLPVLACGGGGGGGGGESGPTGLVGPQSSTAGRPAGATFGRPTGTSFGSPGAAGYVGGINMGTPATVNGAFGGHDASSSRPWWIPRGPRGSFATLAEDQHEQSLRDRETPAMTEARHDKLYHDMIEGTLAGGEAAAEGAKLAGTVAQAVIAVKTAGASTWLQTSGKILLSGARGAADGYAHAAEKGEGGEISQAIFSGGTAATIEAATTPFNPYVGVGGSVLADHFLHGKPSENKAPRPEPVQDLTFQPVQDIYGQPLQR